MKHTLPPRTNRTLNAKRQQMHYSVTVRNVQVIILALKKLLNIKHSNLYVCSHNYRASNDQAPCHIVVVGQNAAILFQLSHLAHNFEKHKICVLVFSIKLV